MRASHAYRRTPPRLSRSPDRGTIHLKQCVGLSDAQPRTRTRLQAIAERTGKYEPNLCESLLPWPSLTCVVICP